MAPLTIRLRAPTAADLEVGRGVPSGPGGEWRVFEIGPEALPLQVVYVDRVVLVTTAEQWRELPGEGVQVVVACGGLWKGADEYRLAGWPLYGTYLLDESWALVEAAARAGLAAEREARRGD